jgi:hypothetical protein
VRTREAVYEQWAPEGTLWSPWVKPVVFTALVDRMLEATHAERPPDPGWTWLPDANSATGVVLDLPAAAALRLAVVLARRGFRPVPLFNGVPGPLGGFVPAEEMCHALVGFGDDLAKLSLPPDAPPAFVLDSGRMAGGRIPGPSEFDNRWMVFAQDLPSGGFLRDHGVRRVLVIQESRTVADDLCHVLRGFRETGVEVLVKVPGTDADPETASLPRGSWLRTVFFRASVLMRLRRNSAGGFGASVPNPQSSGFYG